MRLWKTRVDCWYEPHRNIGQKPKQPKRVVRWVLTEAPTSADAINGALEYAERTASASKGRRWMSFEHRETAAIKLPMELPIP